VLQYVSTIKYFDTARYKSYKETQGVSEFLTFDLSKSGIDPDSVVSASLRIYQVPNPGARDIREQVDGLLSSHVSKCSKFRDPDCTSWAPARDLISVFNTL